MNNKKLDSYYIECGKGWEKLYMPIFEYIENYNLDKNEENKIQVIQVKEKFGQLRFYTNFVTPELKKLIDNAENKSWDICEMCGTEKYIGNTNHYISVYCIDCLKLYLEKLPYKLKEKWTYHKSNEIFNVDKENINDLLKIIKK